MGNVRSRGTLGADAPAAEWRSGHKRRVLQLGMRSWEPPDLEGVDWPEG